jgi:hypothetical protein
LKENYKVIFKEDSANYTIKCLIEKTGMGRAKCSIIIINPKTGELLAKSKEVGGQTAMWNGYENPKKKAMDKLAKHDLIDLIKEAERKQQVK